jgi:hypothetical protein
LACAFLFVVFVVTDGFRNDAVMLKQLSRVTRVFTGDQCDFTQHVDGAMRDVCEITDRRRDQVKVAGHARYSDMTKAPGEPRPFAEG